MKAAPRRLTPAAIKMLETLPDSQIVALLHLMRWVVRDVVGAPMPPYARLFTPRQYAMHKAKLRGIRARKRRENQRGAR